MSGFSNSSLSSSTSGVSGSSIRSYSSPYFVRPDYGTAAFYPSGNLQGPPNIRGNFNAPYMPSSPGVQGSYRNIPSNVVQHSIGNLHGGQFDPNSLPFTPSYGNSQVMGNTGATNFIGNQGYDSSTLGYRPYVPGLPYVPGAQITTSVGNVVGGMNFGRNFSAGSGLPPSGVYPRPNLTAGISAGNMNVQGENRMMLNVPQQGTPQVLSMPSSSYPNAGGPLPQNQSQPINNFSSTAMPNDANSSDGPSIDTIRSPQWPSRPSSTGGTQGQLGLPLQAASPTVQPTPEFNILNENFPPLGSKGSKNDFSVDLQRKEQVHDSSAPIGMQRPQSSMGSPSGVNIRPSHTSRWPKQQQKQASSAGASTASISDATNKLRGPDMPSHSSSHSQGSAASPGAGARPVNSSGSMSGAARSGKQVLPQYQQQHQTQLPFRTQQAADQPAYPSTFQASSTHALDVPQYQQHQTQLPSSTQQMPAANQPYRDQSASSSTFQASTDTFDLQGLGSVMRTSNPDLDLLSLGIDLTDLGLDMSSSESLYRTFASPWSDEPLRGDPEFTLPSCYATPTLPLTPANFPRFQLLTLFYIFYSMPRDEAQLLAAKELYDRGWFFHKELRQWLSRVPTQEPLVKTPSYERGVYFCFDETSWKFTHKDNFILQYDMVAPLPTLPPPA